MSEYVAEACKVPGCDCEESVTPSECDEARSSILAAIIRDAAALRAFGITSDQIANVMRAAPTRPTADNLDGMRRVCQIMRVVIDGIEQAVREHSQ